MKKKSAGLRTYLYLTSAAILLAGVVSVVLVYRAALDETTGEAGHEVVGGFIFPVLLNILRSMSMTFSFTADRHPFLRTDSCAGSSDYGKGGRSLTP